jgi:hypothetical protein
MRAKGNHEGEGKEVSEREKKGGREDEGKRGMQAQGDKGGGRRGECRRKRGNTHTHLFTHALALPSSPSPWRYPLFNALILLSVHFCGLLSLVSVFALCWALFGSFLCVLFVSSRSLPSIHKLWNKRYNGARGGEHVKEEG